MDIFEALYTTRAMRRVKPDPVPMEVQAQILDAAVRAPSGGNQQNWRFLLVDDQGVKDRIAPLYKSAIDQLWESYYQPLVAAAEAKPDDPESKQFIAVQRSAQWLGDHFAEVPLFLFAFCQYDPSGGSIFPAVWNAMLAARAQGVGSCLTAVLNAFYNDEVLEILEVPGDQGWIMAGCVSMGYPTGSWGTAKRTPAHLVAGRNSWTGDLGFVIPEALWTPKEGITHA